MADGVSRWIPAADRLIAYGAGANTHDGDADTSIGQAMFYKDDETYRGYRQSDWSSRRNFFT